MPGNRRANSGCSIKFCSMKFLLHEFFSPIFRPFFSPVSNPSFNPACAVPGKPFNPFITP